MDGLKEVYFSEGITSSSGEFYDCPNIKEFVLPSTLYKIIWPLDGGSYHKLPYNVEDGGYYLGTQNNPYFLLAYKDPQKSSISIRSECEIIGPYAFEKSNQRLYIDMYSNIKSICNYAFSNCTNTSFKIQPNLKYIGECAFENCKALGSSYKDVIISVEEIGTCAFWGFDCNSLTLQGTKKIASGMLKFSKCKALNLPATLAEYDTISYGQIIGAYAPEVLYLTSISIEQNDKYESVDNKYIIDKTTHTLIIGTSSNNLVLQEGITAIGTKAFCGGSNITNITLPESLQSIGDSAFAYTKLDSITFPDSVTTIGHAAFNHTLITSLTIPKALRREGSDKNPFVGLSLESITVPQENEYFEVYNEGLYTLMGTRILLTSTIHITQLHSNTEILAPGSICNPSLTYLEFPSRLWGLEGSPFMNTSLQQLVLPEGLRYNSSNWSYDAFQGVKIRTIWNHSSLQITAGSSDYRGIAKNAVEIYTNGEPSQITESNNMRIYTDLITSKVTLLDYLDTVSTSVTIPSSVDYIKKDAFEKCSQITQLVISNPDVILEEGALGGLVNLVSLTVPNLYKNSTSNTFSHLQQLFSIYGNAEYSPGITLENLTILSGTISYDFININFKNIKNLTLGPGIIYNSDSTLQNLSKLESFTLSSNQIITLSYMVPYSNTQTIDLGSSSITTISDYCFQNFNNLKNIILPSGLTTIGEYAFSSTGLYSLELPSSLTTIGGYAFENTQLIEICNHSSLDLQIGSDNYGQIAKYARRIYTTGSSYIVNNNGYVSYEPDQNTKILIDWPIEETIQIPSGTTEIADQMSGGYLNSIVKHVILPYGLQKIGNNAFHKYKKLLSVNIPSTVTNIGSDIIWYDSEVKELNFPAGISTRLSDPMINSGNKLETIYFEGNNWTNINISTSNAFHNYVGKEGVTTFNIASVLAVSTDQNFINVYLPSTLTTITNPGTYFHDKYFNIYFNGTLSDWNNNVTKASGWEGSFNDHATIYCSDGAIILKSSN